MAVMKSVGSLVWLLTITFIFCLHLTHEIYFINFLIYFVNLIITNMTQLLIKKDHLMQKWRVLSSYSCKTRYRILNLYSHKGKC